MDCWKHALWCSSAPTHVIEVGWSIERFRWPSDMASVLALRNTFFGPGVHRTFPPAAHIYTFCLQFTRMVSIGRSDVFRFANLWTHRAQCLGCVRGMVEACRAIAVDWCAPCELSAGVATFNFSPVQSHYSVSFEVGEFRHATRERASWMSKLRSFLRFAVSRFSFHGSGSPARLWLAH